jgi:hypothetical protein
MKAEDWLKGVEKKLVIAQCMDREKVLLPHTSSLVRQRIGGRLTVTPMLMSAPSCGMSSRLVSALTIYLVDHEA